MAIPIGVSNLRAFRFGFRIDCRLFKVVGWCGCRWVGDCAQSLFRDGIQPAAAADTIPAQQAYARSVPEPSEMVMLAVGLPDVVGTGLHRLTA